MLFPSNRQSKGFALLITITLLAFLVLLLVSLAALTRVETQVASNNQQLAQARQNALMALNIAIGQLQKYAGPDQRTTARADMDATLANVSTKSGRWVAAYGRAVATADAAARDLYTDIPSKISADIIANSDASGNQAVKLNWLVSGNEGTGFSPGAAIDPNGQIDRAKAPSTFAFVPDGAVNLTGTPTALSTDIIIKDTTGSASPARLLVGPNSVTALSDYVAAPLIPITAIMPGLSSSGVPVGRYAWWVGDEGTKARINLPLTAITAAEKANAFISSQRSAIELVDGKNAVGSTAVFNSADLLNTAFPPTQNNLTSILNTNQLPLLTPASATLLAAACKYRFHDLTGYSTSVLSDIYAGGLKKDLSVILAPDPNPARTPMDTDFVFRFEPPATGSNVNELGLPTWGQLRSFAQTTDTNGAATPGLASAPPILKMQPASTLPSPSTQPVATTMGISPIMTYFVLGFKYVAPGTTDALGFPAAGNQIRLAAYPIIVMWNPYTTDMLPQKYEAGIQRPSYAGGIELAGHSGPANPTYTWSIANRIENRDLCYANDTNSTTKSDPYFRFIINSTKGIKAGQSMVFTLQSSGRDYISANPSNMLSDGDYFPNYYVLLANKGAVVGTAPAPVAAPPYTDPSTGITRIYTAGENTYRVGVNQDTSTTFYQSKKASQTYFGSPSPSPGNGQLFSWNGFGNHQAYLGNVMPASAKPSGSTPYTLSGSAVTSRQWYQSMNWQWTANVGEAPYGYNVAFPTDPAASVVIPSGYTDAGKWTGLLQSENRLEVIGSKPAWRMLVKSNFQELSSSWVSQNNPRGFQSTNSQIYMGIANFSGGAPGNNTKIPASQWPPFFVTIDSSDGLAKSKSGTDWWQPSINETTLFEVRPGTQPLLSIGQLQHANLSWIAANPAYAIGNSLAPSFLGAQTLNPASYTLPAAFDKVARLQTELTPAGQSAVYANGYFKALYDQSWLLNRTLWDHYFVSTVPNKGTGTDSDTATLTASTPVPAALPNPRHIRYNIDPAATSGTVAGMLRNADTAAAHLMLAGGFNINSTSEQAWRSILAGTNQLSYDPTGANVGGAPWPKAVFSRFAKPTTNATANTWLGYRQLTDAQIAQFAKNIVAEIRNRGPFVALADFINRRLVDNPAPTSPLDERLKGTLQTVLEDATTGINPATPAPITFAPQYLTQADVLSTLGNGLSARSDTFVIRTYGESLDAVNSTAAAPVITGRAWCEAVVQRMPDYVDPGMAPEIQLTTALSSPAKTTNQSFGRKFKIISFRWLSPNDI